VAFEFLLPDIGEGLTEAEIVEWLVDLGQVVRLDQPLVRVETDKAVTDIPAPRAGVLQRQGAPAGSVVKVGDVLAVIGEPAESTQDQASPIVGTLLEAVPLPAAALPRARALPLVRKLARERGVDLGHVPGSGPDGRITREDVERAAASRAGSSRPWTGPSDSAEERVRLSKLRRTIAERMSRSWREIPHVTTFGEADATRLMEARVALGERHARSIPLEALFVKAVLPALRAHPEFNATLDGDDLVLKRRYDIGVAVDTPDGLIVPVVRAADGLDLFALSQEASRLSEAAVSRTASPADLAGATFTISNIGAVGGGYGTPIIPYGTTAILSFGRAAQKPVVRNGAVQAVVLLPLSLSFDHRVIDGALGRRFLRMVTENLEQPALFLVG
jgi:pyruvate dehydrogenase E2 component (dihydrolipoamide acetyltransferase)